MMYRSIQCISEDSSIFLQATKRLAAVSFSPVPYMLGAGRIEVLVTGKPGRACVSAWHGALLVVVVVVWMMR